MARLDGNTMSFVAGTGGLAAYRLVKLSSGTAVYNTATSTDDPLGVTEYLAEAGKDVSAKLLNKGGTVEIEAAGAITAGAKVYAAADGKVQALPTGAGTYRQVGVALEAASAAGAVIEVLPYGYNLTATVSAG